MSLKRLAESLPHAAAPQFAQSLEHAMAIVGQISVAAQIWSNEFPPMGHRPLGTEGACADVAAEGRAIQAAKCTERNIHNMLVSFVDMNVERRLRRGVCDPISARSREVREQSLCKIRQALSQKVRLSKSKATDAFGPSFNLT